MIVRDADVQDLDAIRVIWNHYIQTTAHNWRYEGYTPEELRGWLGMHGTPDHPVLVAEDEGRIIGFGALSTFRQSPGYQHTAEDTIYLAPDVCGCGAGTQLMKALLERGEAGGLWHVVSMIDSQNIRSIRFHQKFGFETIGVLKDIGWKFGKVLSCVVMQKRF